MPAGSEDVVIVTGVIKALRTLAVIFCAAALEKADRRLGAL